MEMICRLHAAAIARHDGGSKLNLANAMPTRRLILVPIGLILSIAASFIFLLVAGFAEPAGRRLLEAVGWIFWEAARSNALQGDPPGSFRVLAAQIIWWATIAVVVAPIFITALIGELARLQSFLWYVCAPALLTPAIPFIARNARVSGSNAIRDAASRSVETQADEPRLALLLFLAGALAGFIYWAVARQDHSLTPKVGPRVSAPPST
jgi:hypothetical protein